MTKTILLTLEEVAALLAWKGKPLTVQAVRYRIKKSKSRGLNISYQKAKAPNGKMVDAITSSEAKRLWKLWQSFHV